jgi:hypothetical protein
MTSLFLYEKFNLIFSLAIYHLLHFERDTGNALPRGRPRPLISTYHSRSLLIAEDILSHVSESQVQLRLT